MHEPATTLTDYGLTLLCLVFGILLLRQSRSVPVRAVRWWGGAFFALAAGSAAGGTVHGFGPQLGPAIANGLWLLTAYAIGATAWAMALATTLWLAVGRVRQGLVWGWCAVYAVYFVVIPSRSAFVWIIAFYAPALIFVLFAHTIAGLRRGHAASPWIVAGCALSAVAAGIQQSGLALASWFNHNDLYHVVQAVALYLWYLGGRRLTDA